MRSLDVSGIYMIKNLVTGKIYIGSSKNIRKRKNQHYCQLRKGTHINNNLQRSFDKHGESNFIHSVVEDCDINQLETREQYYLDLYSGNLYNCFKTAYSVKGENHPMFGKTHSDAARLKIKEARSRQIISHSLETRKKIGRPGKMMPMDHIMKMVAARNGKAWNKGIKTGIAPKNKVVLTSEKQTELLNTYKSGKSIVTVSQIFKLDWDVTKRILTENNIPVRQFGTE